mmetsp:Transcript_12860/g.19539  ORF Transcript_12860/g.19539 Transcript_12860/m.19539 type:complete len:219 (+) Transcript_12860:1-657(+)
MSTYHEHVVSEDLKSESDTDEWSYDLTLNKENAAETNQSLLLGHDIQTEIVSKLQKMKHHYAEMSVEARKELLSALDKKQASEVAHIEAKDEVNIVRGRKNKSDETLNREKETQEASLAIRLREVEKMERTIADIRDPVAVEEAIARYESQCVELEALRRRHQEEYLSTKKAVKNEINHALTKFLEHKEYQETKVTELELYAVTKEAEFGSIQNPAEK